MNVRKNAFQILKIKLSIFKRVLHIHFSSPHIIPIDDC
ncbi:PolC-type DNA polymerase III N-terminal domain-containing protein [Alkalihalobacillus sp. R86527]